MKRSVLTLVLILSAASWSAASDPICIGEVVTIDSKVMGEQRTIHVSTPPGYERGEQRYPVLYMTDGPQHLSHTRGTVDFLSRTGVMPQLIIVGVANTDRTRDLTPTNADYIAPDGTVRPNPTSGGANTFLDFFEKELFPLIDDRYRTEPLRLFSGHSFGGLFALEAFFKRPQMFSYVLAIGPTLRWDQDLPLKQAASFFKERKRHDAALVVAMANEERNDPAPTHLDRLETILKNARTEGFEWSVLRYPDETHGSVVLRAQMWGLRRLFAEWAMPRDPETGAFEGTLDDLKAHYAGISKRFGYTVTPAEDLINNLGYQLLAAGRTDDAIAIFQYNAATYPQSANVFDSLGEAYENAGKLEEALASYSRATENAALNGDERLELFAANRDRVEGALEK